MLKDDIMAVKKELKEVKEKGFGMELLSDYKKQNKRQFIIILVILALWFITIGYLVYVLNDIGVVETSTQEITDIETIENSTIRNGGK
jgi:uncharacterized membrane protein